MEEQEAVVAENSQDSSADAGFDMEQASGQLASDLFPGKESDVSVGNTDDETTNSETDNIETASSETEISETETSETETSEEIDPPPQSWPNEMHEFWKKTPKEVRDYWNTREKQMFDGLEKYKVDAAYGKSMRDAVTPYMALIQAQGIDAPKAVQTLLNAHYKLSVSPPSQKLQYLNYLAKQYGIDTGLQQSNEATETDPRYQQLQDQLYQIQQHLIEQQQSVQRQEHERIVKEVNAFASDVAHPYFDEVADDMIPFIKAGVSLQDAYDKAVWANPVTRAKEQARVQQEQQAEAKRKAQEAVEAAKKASAANIRSRDTRMTPTEKQRGTMRNLDSVMTEVMREIKQTH